MSVNKVTILGRVGKDPEARYTADGNAIASASVATSEKWKDKSSGEMKEATEWHRIVAYGRTAEVIEQYVKKGDQLYVEGSLRTREWEDKQGNKRQTTEIKADKIVLLTKREEDKPKPKPKAPQKPFNIDDDSDVPF